MINLLYRHYKGGLYQTLADVAKHTETEEEVVVYMSVETEKVWVRPYEMFHSLVTLDDGLVVARFSEIDE